MTLKDFYRAYLTWIEADAPEGGVFSRRYGLCYNLTSYCQSKEVEDTPLLAELYASFKAAGLRVAYPFCSHDDYAYRRWDSEQHTLPARIEWVRRHAE